jgi:hypothetical protein
MRDSAGVMTGKGQHQAGLPSGSWLLSWLWLGCALASAGFAVYGILLAVQLWRVAPFADEWAGVNFYHGWIEGTKTFKDILAQHNEHRIPFTRLLFLIDLHFFRGQAVLTHVANLLSYIGLGAILGLLATWRSPNPAERAMAVSSSIALTVAPVQIHNLAFAFQIQMSLVCLFSVIAFFAISRLTSPIALAAYWVNIAIAAAAVAFAPYSSANGFVATALAVTVAWSLSVGWPARAIITAVAALAVASFFHDYQLISHPAPPSSATLVERAGYIADYVFAFLGSIGQRSGLNGAIQLGMAGAALWAVLAIYSVVLWYRNALEPAITALMTFATFVLITALLGAVSRGMYGAHQALSTRYATFSVVFIVSLFAVLWRLIAMFGDRYWPVRFVPVVTVSILLVVAYRIPFEYYVGKKIVADMDTATTDLRAGRFNPEHVKHLYPDPDHVRLFIDFLRARRLSLFAD